MSTLLEELRGRVERTRGRVTRVSGAPRTEELGVVEHIGDGIALVSGLPSARLDELVVFDDETHGIVMELDATLVGCVLLDAGTAIRAGSKVHGTGRVARVAVGEGLLGRVVDPIGQPLDDGPPIVPKGYEPLERAAPGIVDRELVTEPLETGITVVDAMIPLGRGQRELIIGDRKTGKTAIAIDTMIHQKKTDVTCVYAAVGQKTSNVTEVIDAVKRHGDIDRCVFVVGAADASPGAQWLAPYAACTIAEYFRDRGGHALLIIDDLTKHAAVYRQLALLLRHPPGREAYPGDIFYIHSRLLERAARLSDSSGGGSLTALPIAETLAGNMSAYIPTNLISITDGQIYLEPKLFYAGQKPAVDVGKSVSRVGGKTQAPATRLLAETLRLEYSQFLELEIFTRFGGMIDERTRRTVEHGKRIRSVLNQPQYAPLPLGLQTALLLALSERTLDAIAVDEVPAFRSRLAAVLPSRCAVTLARIDATGALSDEDRLILSNATRQIAAEYTAKEATDVA